MPARFAMATTSTGGLVIPSESINASAWFLADNMLKRYHPILEEKPRCWRLNYANEFHLDITPSISNNACANGGEPVPDKALQCWKATNPKGYRDAFERRNDLLPRIKSIAEDRARADANVEPYPEQARFKGLLCRIVQIAKRHRDVHFLKRDANLTPISVIITTLAAWSYEYCVRTYVYDSELDVLCDVIRHMPDENFAERWNSEPARAQAFFEWHAAAVADLERLAQSEGLDRLRENLTESFGQTPASDLLNELFAEVTAARRSGTLLLAPLVGLAATSAVPATPVRANTFYGAP
jgi:hypothetical protein